MCPICDETPTVLAHLGLSLLGQIVIVVFHAVGICLLKKHKEASWLWKEVIRVGIVMSIAHAIAFTILVWRIGAGDVMTTSPWSLTWAAGLLQLVWLVRLCVLMLEQWTTNLRPPGGWKQLWTLPNMT